MRGRYHLAEMIIAFVLVFAVIYLLYMNGFIPITVKSAVMFIGSRKCKKATFTSCNGYMKRIIKLEKDRDYYFKLDTRLTGGRMSVELIDKNKQIVLRLDEDHNIIMFDSNYTGRYTLMIRFHSATGEYKLKWD